MTVEFSRLYLHATSKPVYFGWYFWTRDWNYQQTKGWHVHIHGILKQLLHLRKSGRGIVHRNKHQAAEDCLWFDLNRFWGYSHPELNMDFRKGSPLKQFCQFQGNDWMDESRSKRWVHGPFVQSIEYIGNQNQGLIFSPALHELLKKSIMSAKILIIAIDIKNWRRLTIITLTKELKNKSPAVPGF